MMSHCNYSQRIRCGITSSCHDTSYNKDKVLGTAASRVYFHLKAEAVRMERKWSDACYLGPARPSRSLSAASLIRSIRFKQVVPPSFGAFV